MRDTASDSNELALLLDEVYATYHHDFRGYAMASLRRRVDAAVAGMGLPDVRALRAEVRTRPDVFQRLLSQLTVQVSDLFRDPLHFAAFRAHVVPELLTYPSVKLWIAGCAGGEEVYSHAIVLQEEGLLERTTIYATDVSVEALARGQVGVYARERLDAFDENYRRAGGRGALSDHCAVTPNGLTFHPELRRSVVFSDHSLATDAVFAEVQVVSCRNVLIYFGAALKERAVGLFREALCRKGFLGLGARESLQAPIASGFQAIAMPERWYRRC